MSAMPELDDPAAILAEVDAVLDALDAPGEPTDPAPWVVDSEDKADWCLRKLAKVRAELAAVSQMAARQTLAVQAVIQDRLDEIQGWAHTESSRLEREAEKWETQLAVYHYRRLEDTERIKTIRLPHGTLTARKKPDSWVCDGAFIEWAREEAPELLRTEADLPAVKRALEVVDGCVVEVTGYEVVDGKRVITSFTAVPGVTVNVGAVKYEAVTE